MFTGGDGYTALTGGTDVLQPGDALLDVVIDYIGANSPVRAGRGGPHHQALVRVAPRWHGAAMNHTARSCLIDRCEPERRQP